MSAAAFASSAITKGAPARQPRARSPARPAPLRTLSRWRGLWEEAASATRSWTYRLAGPKKLHTPAPSPSCVARRGRAKSPPKGWERLGYRHTSFLVCYKPLAHEPWKPRPGDDISSNWLIAELTHRQAHGLELPMGRKRTPTPTSHVVGLEKIHVY